MEYDFRVCLLVVALVAAPVVRSADNHDVHADNDDDSGCNTKEVDACVGESHSDLGSAIIPYLSDSELNRLCADLETIQTCLADVSMLCEASNTTDPTTKAEVSQRIDEVTGGRSYMCDPATRATYEETVRPCYESNQDTLDPAGADCLGSYRNQTWWLDPSDKINVYKYCSSAQEYLACQTDSVKEACGEVASEWVYNYHLGLWESHMKSIKCSVDDGMEGGAIVIIALCSGAIIYCVFFVALGFIRDSDKFQCAALKKHTRPGYMYKPQSQEPR